MDFEEVKEIIHSFITHPNNLENLVHFVTLDDQNRTIFFSTLESIYIILNRYPDDDENVLSIYDYSAYKDEKFLYIKSTSAQYGGRQDESRRPLNIKIPISLLDEFFILERLK